jgi:hypothetical protein
MALARFTHTGELHYIHGWARPRVYETWLQLLSARDYKLIKHAMNAAVDRKDVVRAQYIVCEEGDHWHEVYHPVYEAMGRSREFAGKFIGLLLWEVMQDRQDDWIFHKIDKTVLTEYNLVEDIQVMEYFRAQGFPRPGRWRQELRREQTIDALAASLRNVWKTS